MNLLSISLRNLSTRRVSTVLTMISVAVGAALLAALWLLVAETEKRYRASTSGYDAVVGAKEGAPLALVLNTVFNLGMPIGPMSFSVYEELRQRRELRYAIPQARGDTFGGFPVVGTTDEMFSKFRRGLSFARGFAFEFSHADAVQFAADLAAGKVEIAHEHHEHKPGEEHDHSHPSHPLLRYEAVIGAAVARQLGLKIGDKITPVHGGADEAGAHVHEESACTVIGELAPTGTPVDRAIYVPLSVFLAMDGHGDAVREVDGKKQVSLTAVVVDPIGHLGAAWLRREFQTRRDAQVAWSVFEVGELLRVVAGATQVLRVVSYLVLVVAAVAVMVALYNTMNERRREIAIMRALGARRSQILCIILQESVVIAGLGAVLGVALCHAAFAVPALQRFVQDNAGVGVDWAAFTPDELWLIVGAVVLGGLAGVIPALKGARTQVADNLAPTS